MTSWFYQVKQGRLETELLEVTLTSDQHGGFRGQGFLSRDRNKGIEIHPLTDRGKDLAEKFWSGNPQLAPGSLMRWPRIGGLQRELFYAACAGACSASNWFGEK